MSRWPEWIHQEVLRSLLFLSQHISRRRWRGCVHLFVIFLGPRYHRRLSHILARRWCKAVFVHSSWPWRGSAVFEIVCVYQCCQIIVLSTSFFFLTSMYIKINRCFTNLTRTQIAYCFWCGYDSFWSLKLIIITFWVLSIPYISVSLPWLYIEKSKLYGF